MLGNKAVLVYSDTDQDFFWSMQRIMDDLLPPGEFGKPKVSLPPLGLMGLADNLNPFYNEILLTDRRVDPRALEGLIEDADHVYIGANGAQENHLKEDIKTVQSLGKPLIIGGHVVTDDSYLRDIDALLVKGEAEMVMEHVLNDLADGKTKGFYPGTITPPERFFVPDYNVINLDNYMSMSMQTSRGCPFICDFCDIIAKYGRKMRYATKEQIQETIKRQFEAGSRMRNFIVDDNFIGDPDRAIQNLKWMYEIEEQLGFHPPKYTQLDMRLALENKQFGELRYWLNKTLFDLIFMGIETDNEKALEGVGKNQNLRGEKSLNEKMDYVTKETGAALSAAMMYGFDQDTNESKESLINTINSLSAPLAMVSLLNSPPNTPLDLRLKKEGRLMRTASLNNTDGTMNFIPYNMSAKQAEENYIDIVNRIYTPKAFFGRVMNLLETFDTKAPEAMGPEAKRTYMKEGAAFLGKLLTKGTGGVTMRYMIPAAKIAGKRYGFNTPEFWGHMGKYLTFVANYHHLRSHVGELTESQKERTYEPWQLYSWKEIQESSLESLTVEEPNPLSLLDTVKMRLTNGYEFMGSRLEALSHFVEPYLTDALQKINEKKPQLEKFIQAELEAYRKAYDAWPGISGNIDFSKIETYIKEKVDNQKNYFNDMMHVLEAANRGRVLVPIND